MTNRQKNIATVILLLASLILIIIMFKDNKPYQEPVDYKKYRSKPRMLN